MAGPAQQVPDDASSGALTDIPFWRAPWEFAVHAIIGTAIFAIIAGAAVVLHTAISAMEMHDIGGGVIIFGLKVAEYALFGMDLLLFAVFLWRTAKRSIKYL